jgi:uncharacterized protein
VTTATDPFMNVSPPQQSESLPAAATVHFCRSCGASLPPTVVACPRCAVSPTASDAGEGGWNSVLADNASITSAVAFYFVLLVVSIVFVSLPGFGNRATVAWYVTADIVLSTLVLGWCVAQRHRLLPVLARPVSPRWYFRGVAAAAVSFVVATTAVAFFRTLGGSGLNYTNAFVAEGFGFWLPVLIVAVQPAIFEELAFRGSIQSSLQGVLKPRDAIVVTAMMFAILHVSVPSLPHLFALGLVLGWLRHASGSLYPAMLMHFSHNFLVLLDERCGGILPW